MIAKRAYHSLLLILLYSIYLFQNKCWSNSKRSFFDTSLRRGGRRDAAVALAVHRCLTTPRRASRNGSWLLLLTCFCCVETWRIESRIPSANPTNINKINAVELKESLRYEKEPSIRLGSHRRSSGVNIVPETLVTG